MADEKATITPLNNGPYMVKGPFRLVDAQGREFTLEGDEVYLCRCGQSANKPFCDGTHRKVGFSSQVEAR